jgi:hypothetical protein
LRRHKWFCRGNGDTIVTLFTFPLLTFGDDPSPHSVNTSAHAHPVLTSTSSFVNVWSTSTSEKNRSSSPISITGIYHHPLIISIVFCSNIMSDTKPVVLIIGHSFIKRLVQFCESHRESTSSDMNLRAVCTIIYHGIPGARLPHLQQEIPFIQDINPSNCHNRYRNQRSLCFIIPGRVGRRHISVRSSPCPNHQYQIGIHHSNFPAPNPVVSHTARFQFQGIHLQRCPSISVP